jgi:hypothetical protein
MNSKRSGKITSFYHFMFLKTFLGDIFKLFDKMKKQGFPPNTTFLNFQL